MNKATFYGKIVSISDEKQFSKQQTDYKYRVVLFQIADPEDNFALVVGNHIAVTVWERGELPDVDSFCKFTVRITSERNRKDPELFFHKINLHSITVI